MKALLYSVIIATVGFLNACTTIHVVSEPPGADVQVTSMRGVFGWSDWETKCQAPCTVKTLNGYNKVRVRWDDNTISEIRNANIDLFWGTFDFKFVKPPSAPLPLPEQDETTAPAALPEESGPDSP